MIKIVKDEEPGFWKEFKKKNPKISYKKLNTVQGGSEIRRKLREYLLEQQCYICCYCCKQVDLDDLLNEHIHLEDYYPNETMDYSNIVVSCAKDNKICGLMKDNKYDEKLFVSPLDDDCEEHFAFFPNGEIVGVTDKGKYTASILGFDSSYKLKQARAAVYKNCQYLDESSLKWHLEVHDGKLEPFVDVIRYYAKNILG